jgi:C4-type Zn-finger protein
MKVNQMEDFDRIKKHIEEEQRLEDVICPYCDHTQDNESRYHYVTYWGEDGEKECDCEHCGKTFLVNEEVTRHFICSKKEAKDDEL